MKRLEVLEVRPVVDADGGAWVEVVTPEGVARVKHTEARVAAEKALKGSWAQTEELCRAHFARGGR